MNVLNTVASTQYNDWTGSVAFDDHDLKAISKYSREMGHIKENEVIFGFEASYLHSTKQMMVTIGYSNMSFDDFKNSSSNLYKKDFDLPLSDFFTLFKRANFAVSKKGL